ncbi:MAG: gliding motility-associated C-terminal domain-containing protein [Bacteroidales bacterium]|nr:gliding motility-associated C-terminal domain-containing protein [Bacteroidales bacterium]
MKIQRFVLSCLILVLIQTSVSAQLLYNNGVSITAKGGVTVYVGGSVQNQSGQIDIDYTSSASEMIIHGNFVNNATAGGNGYYRVMENWINNNIFNAGTGTVFLEGGVQQLSGSNSTYFYNLTLSGTGAKTQTINQYCTGILNLNNIELKTEIFGFFVQNTNVTAISFGTGFVSSLNGGFLSRQTNVSNVYSFPVGSSVGTPRYRPVEITPTAATANTYTVRMANVDATTEGFDITQLASGVCEINPLFYHQINRTNGTSPINMDIYYDNSADGTWEGIANWNTLPNLWNIIAGSNTAVGAPLYKASAINWSNFSQLPYALYSPSPTATISTTTPSICEGDNILLQETGGDATSWSWQGPNSWSSTDQNPTINSATPLASGTYYVTVTNSYGCTASDNVTITVNALPTANPNFSTNPICSGSSTILSANAVAGSGTITNYAWSLGSIGNNASGTVSTAGTYTVTVTNSNACTVAATSPALAVNPLPTALVLTGSSICALPGGDGVITSNASVSGVNYQLYNSGGTAVQSLKPGTGSGLTWTGLAAGSGYYAVASDATTSCVSANSNIVDITSNPNPTTPVTSIDCSGGVDQGIITVTSPTGGNYEYDISSGYQASPTFGPLTNGNYSITVQDITTGCTNVSSSINLDCGCANPTSLSLSATTGSTCGTDPETIAGNTFGGSATQVSLSHNGNGTLDQTTISTSPFSFTYTPTLADGGTIVTVTITTNNPDGLPCNPSTSTYIITVHALPTATPNFSTNPICSGSSTILSANAVAGSGTITNYAWSLGSIGNNASGTVSTAGTYTVTVTNSNACTVAATSPALVINPLPTALVLTGSSICVLPGGDGVITSNTSISGISYQLYNSGGTVVQSPKPGTGSALTWSGLTAGSGYYAIASDATTSCESANSNIVDITSNPNPDIPVTSIDCTAGEDQGIITVTSPIGNYQYNIGSGWQTLTTFGPLANSNYTITVQDIATSCTNTGSIINLNCGCANPPILTIAATTGSTCGTNPETLAGNTFGGSATQVDLIHNGAGNLDAAQFTSSPFSFTYTPDVADIGSDITITITTNNPDGLPCNPVSDTYIITVNDNPDIPITSTDCSGGNDNAILTVTSPLGAHYEYSIGGAFQAETTFDPLSNGDYTITVNDINTGCISESGIITIDCGCTNPPSLNLSASSENTCGTDIITVSGNTFGGSATQVSLSHDGNGTLFQTIISTSPFNFTYTPNAADIGSNITITITTNNPDGLPCNPVSDTYIITVNDNPEIPIASTDCSGGSNNAILTVTSPLGANYEYSIGGAFQAETTFGSLSNGDYTITVNDINTGCTSESGIITIDCGCTNPPSLNLSASSENTCGTDIITVSGNTFGGSATQVSLSHDGNGTLDQTIISTSPFNFTYTPNAADIGSNITITITTNNPVGLPCNPASDTYVITVLPLPTVLAGSNTPICEGSALNLSETGGDAVSWAWEGPNSFTSSDQNPTITNTTTSAIGQYSVSVTDINGCIASDNVNVLIIASPDPTIDNPGVICSGSATIELTATNSGGVWSGTGVNSDTGEFNPIIAGIGNHEIIYTITGLCGDADTIIISVIETADASINPVDTLFVTDPPITLTATSTEGLWWGTGVDPTSGIFNPAIAGIGDHEIIYTIAAPCGDADTIIIVVIPEIIPDLIIPDVLTPNGDGYNDTWRIQGIRAFEKVEIVIFNRWGDEVFQFSGTGNAYFETQNQFNGIRNNKELPFGTYVYLLELNNDKMYKGTLTIIR